MKFPVLLICPICGEKHTCPKSWFMYETNQWIGRVCLIYCDDRGAIFKLYDEQMRYVTFVRRFDSAGYSDPDEIPF